VCLKGKGKERRKKRPAKTTVFVVWRVAGPRPSPDSKTKEEGKGERAQEKKITMENEVAVGTKGREGWTSAQAWSEYQGDEFFPARVPDIEIDTVSVLFHSALHQEGTVLRDIVALRYALLATHGKRQRLDQISNSDSSWLVLGLE